MRALYASPKKGQGHAPHAVNHWPSRCHAKTRSRLPLAKRIASELLGPT